MPLPTASDLTAYLSGMGVTALAGFDEAAALSAAVEEVEAVVGYSLIADAMASVRVYELDPTVPIITIDPCVAVTLVEVDGAAVSAADYTFSPDNARARLRPIQAVRVYRTYWHRLPRQVEKPRARVSARWGGFEDADVPDVVRRGVMALAAREYLGGLQAQNMSGPAKWQEGDVLEFHTSDLVAGLMGSNGALSRAIEAMYGALPKRFVC